MFSRDFHVSQTGIYNLKQMSQTLLNLKFYTHTSTYYLVFVPRQGYFMEHTHIIDLVPRVSFKYR